MSLRVTGSMGRVRFPEPSEAGWLATDDDDGQREAPPSDSGSVRMSQVKAKDRTLLKWTREAAEAYDESKRLVLRAVALELPDWEGAADGTNPFILLADRRKRAVGAALFQLPARSRDAKATDPRGSLRLLGV